MPADHPIMLDPDAGHVTIINTYVVAPERAEALLARATEDRLRHLPGFISANLHLNGNRTQLVNYAQWRDRDAIAAARDDPAVGALIREAEPSSSWVAGMFRK